MLFDLQFFGEGGSEGVSQDGAQNTQAGAVPAGAQAGAAAYQNMGKATKSGAKAAKSGVQDGNTGERQEIEEPKKATFQELIRGEHKEAFEKEIKKALDKRLKGTKNTVEAYERMLPAMEVLAKKYGIDISKGMDAAAIADAVANDAGMYREEAERMGLSEEQAMERAKLERELRRMQRVQEEQQHQEQQRKAWGEIVRQAEAVKEVYPAFDLEAEMQNPNFMRLLGAGVPVRTVFEVIHKDEINQAMMQYTAQKTSEQIAGSIQANGRRPVENGASGGNPPGSLRTDPKSLSKEEREDIKKRARRGEKVYL